AAPDALDEIDAIVAAAVAARTPTSWTARLAAACRRAWPWPVEPATPADPLHALRHHADAARDGRRVRFAGAAFGAMLDRLPRGEALPPWARGDLHVLFDLARATGADEAVQDRLFEVRFGKALDDAFSRNDHPSDIARLWDVMSGLPAPHVESNRHLQEVRLAPGRAESWYEGNSIHLSDRQLGTRPEAFDSAVRHEVGHAVHRKLDRAQGGIVSDWLADAFGWMEHRAGHDEEESSADNWLALLVPGWPALPHARRAMVRGAVRAALGPGQRWSPPAPPDLPAEHPWHADGFGPRLAFERTGARWYRSTQTWLRSGGRAFFYNFYYGRLMAVDERTLDMIDDCLPSRYAAMSPAEFFAEVYAAYFDPHPDGRARLPADVRDWMAAHVAGAPIPGAASPHDHARPEGDD
ncbi:MAG: hypothetical protein JNK11_14135, partial [Alphaproteobacteria bacterium]|nr:hypothetical protein [Alphaproteobacteria bacterium]